MDHTWGSGLSGLEAFVFIYIIMYILNEIYGQLLNQVQNTVVDHSSVQILVILYHRLFIVDSP